MTFEDLITRFVMSPSVVFSTSIVAEASTKSEIPSDTVPVTRSTSAAVGNDTSTLPPGTVIVRLIGVPRVFMRMAAVPVTSNVSSFSNVTEPLATPAYFFVAVSTTIPSFPSSTCRPISPRPTRAFIFAAATINSVLLLEIEKLPEMLAKSLTVAVTVPVKAG